MERYQKLGIFALQWIGGLVIEQKVYMLCDSLDNQETYSDTSDGDLVLLAVDS